MRALFQGSEGYNQEKKKPPCVATYGAPSSFYLDYAGLTLLHSRTRNTGAFAGPPDLG